MPQNDSGRRKASFFVSTGHALLGCGGLAGEFDELLDAEAVGEIRAGV